MTSLLVMHVGYDTLLNLIVTVTQLVVPTFNELCSYIVVLLPFEQVLLHSSSSILVAFLMEVQHPQKNLYVTSQIIFFYTVVPITKTKHEFMNACNKLYRV